MVVGTGILDTARISKAVETFETIHAAMAYLQVRRAGRIPEKIQNHLEGIKLLRERKLLLGDDIEELKVSGNFRITGVQMSPGTPPQPLYRVWVEGDPEFINTLRAKYADDPRYLTNETFLGCEPTENSPLPDWHEPFCFAYAGASSNKIQMGCQSNQSNLSCVFMVFVLALFRRRKRALKRA